jgi:ATP-binding cassette, subfamily B, bacterial
MRSVTSIDLSPLSRAQIRQTLNARDRYWQLLPHLRPQSRTIVQALVCTLVFIAMSPLLAWIVGGMANWIAQGDILQIARLAGFTTLVFLVQKVAQYGQDALMAKAALAIALDIRKRVYAHLQRLSLSYFESSKSGDLSYRLTEDVDRIGEVVHKTFHDTVPCVLELVALLAYMVYLNWQLTLATFIVAPLMGLLTSWFGEQLLTYSRKSQNRVSDLSARLIEDFSGIRLIQAFAAEDYAFKRFAQEAERNRRAKYRTEHLKAIQFPVVGFLEAVAILFLLFLGGWQISQGNLTSSEFVSYLAAVALLIQPISHLTNNYGEFKQAEASIDRAFELLDVQPTVIEQPNAVALPPVSGKVEYRHVAFAYSPDRPVIQDLSLLAMPGEAIALVGASGAGKTTLVNLLTRFYDPDAGAIYIDGIDIRQVSLKSLRRQIGTVPQETILFSGTIAENIAFGQAQCDLESIQKAARIANAHQFIETFPQGYQTWVGERGVNLSGGQRQRLAIARAVLLNPRILILDEATSSLDSESEALVQEAIERLMQNRTVFIIAHRLATVRRAHRILVLEQGQVVESGTHGELLDKGGRYAGFYAQQFQN